MIPLQVGQPDGERDRRVWSLWDIMNVLRLRSLAILLRDLTECRIKCEKLKGEVGGGCKAEEPLLRGALGVFRRAGEVCLQAGLRFSEHKVHLSLMRLEKDGGEPDISSLFVELSNADDAIMTELWSRKFLRVREDLTDWLDRDDLFGEKAVNAFPSAKRDIREAGNCLAADCPTGCVFHLMRASEVALRALAADCGVRYPNASLAAKQVGDLLSALDAKLKELRNEDSNKWPSRDIKDAQLKFYHEAMAEFRDFNEAWRRHLAHAHEGAFYDTEGALSIMNHVRKFMQVLAEKISELGATPLYWTSA